MSENNPIRAGEDFKVFTPHQRNEGDTRPIGRFNGKRCGCRNRRQNGTAEDRSLLDHLHRQATGDGHHASTGRYVRIHDGTCEFVESVVATDIFTHRQQSLVNAIKPCTVNGPCLPVEALCVSQRLHRGDDVMGVNGEFYLAHIRHHANRLLYGFYTAKTATDRTCHIPSSGPQGIGIGILQIHLNIIALPGLDHLDGTDVSTRRYDALCQAETDGKIAEIGRTGHHHGMRTTAV